MRDAGALVFCVHRRQRILCPLIPITLPRRKTGGEMGGRDSDDHECELRDGKRRRARARLCERQRRSGKERLVASGAHARRSSDVHTSAANRAKRDSRPRERESVAQELKNKLHLIRDLEFQALGRFDPQKYYRTRDVSPPGTIHWLAPIPVPGETARVD